MTTNPRKNERCWKCKRFDPVIDKDVLRLARKPDSTLKWECKDNVECLAFRMNPKN